MATLLPLLQSMLVFVHIKPDWQNVSFHLLLMIMMRIMIGFLPGSSNFPLKPGFTNALIFLSVYNTPNRSA